MKITKETIAEIREIYLDLCTTTEKSPSRIRNVIHSIEADTIKENLREDGTKILDIPQNIEEQLNATASSLSNDINDLISNAAYTYAEMGFIQGFIYARTLLR